MKRASLRGKENLTKRNIASALTYNLSLLMRKKFGHGAPKQLLVAAFFAGWKYLKTLFGVAQKHKGLLEGFLKQFCEIQLASVRLGVCRKCGIFDSFSTGC